MNSTSPFFTVIICAYNPNPLRLDRVLNHLREQTLSLSEWELIIVDNHSDTPIISFADVAWHPRARFLKEEKQGQIFARLAGISASMGKWIVFVDDDNLLAADYLVKALEIIENHTFLGVFGGDIQGGFERQPSSHLAPYLELLAIRHVKKEVWANFAHWPCMPSGAGMVIKRDLALKHAHALQQEPRLLRLSRAGTAMMSGDDVDMVLTCLENKQATGMFPGLKLTHVIPAGRLEEKYMLALVAGITASAAYQQFVRYGKERVHWHIGLRPLYNAAIRMLKWKQGSVPAFFFEWRRIRAIQKGHRIAKELIKND